MADRIVVMNHGVIEQIGTPMRGLPRSGDAVRRRLRRQDQRAVRAAASGRRPAHRRAAASRASTTPTARARRQGLPAARGRAARGRSRPATPMSSTARSTRSSSSARTASSASAPRRCGAQPITVYLSLNFLAEQGLAVGSRLPLTVPPDRMRFFEAPIALQHVSAVLAASPRRAPLRQRAHWTDRVAHALLLRSALALVVFLALPLATILAKALQDRAGAFVGLRQLRELPGDAGAAAVDRQQRLGRRAGDRRHHSARVRLRLRARAQLHPGQGHCCARSR